MTELPRWGVVATVKASATDILNFAAYYLELGASHIWIYLDAPNPEAKALLKAHPQITPVSTGENYWQKMRGKRPPMHQNRQSYNARHAYRRARDVSWLLHCDVDELLWSEDAVATHLADLPEHCHVARVRPQEALAPTTESTEPHLFKAFIREAEVRNRLVAEVYPTFSPYLKGGFVSHVAGKIFVRTGHDNMRLKIHNVLQNDTLNPGHMELTDMALLHLHTTSWAHWQRSFAYRHEKGSYRAELGTATPEAEGGLNLHDLFAQLAQEPDGLRRFYEEACLAAPPLTERLKEHGLLREHHLHLEEKRKRHFPDF